MGMNIQIDSAKKKTQKLIFSCQILDLAKVIHKGGFGSGGSGFGQIRCPSVENNLTDNPSVNRP